MEVKFMKDCNLMIATKIKFNFKKLKTQKIIFLVKNNKSFKPIYKFKIIRKIYKKASKLVAQIKIKQNKFKKN
jgi:hypothetical protein